MCTGRKAPIIAILCEKIILTNQTKDFAMKTKIIPYPGAALLLVTLLFACGKEATPPVEQIALPGWEVNQPRTLLYQIDGRSYSNGEVVERNTFLEIEFLGGGAVRTRFADESKDYFFMMDSTGLLSFAEPDQNYSPILDVLHMFPAQGLSNAKPGSEWKVFTPSEQYVQDSQDEIIVQAQRNFRIVEADHDNARIKQDGYLRIVDNEAAKTGFLEVFGNVKGHLVRAAWTKWRYFQTGETEYSSSCGCIVKADYTGVILPIENLDENSLYISPEREELTIRRRP